jgi:hypothetical protein
MVFLSDYVESSCEVFWGTNRVPLWRYNIHSYKMQASILGIDMLNNGVEISILCFNPDGEDVFVSKKRGEARRELHGM